MNRQDIESLQFNTDGLIPAIVQDSYSGMVLMLAYMNKHSLEKSIETGETHFWSRSRNELWHKGTQSGNIQKVKSIRFDCDADALLVQVEQTGNACHTGEKSCFFRTLHEAEETAVLGEVIAALAGVISDRKKELPEGSYTTYLFQSGLDKILKKVGEESAETIIAAKNHNKQEIASEVADLIYHLLVMFSVEDVRLGDIAQQLLARKEKASKSRMK